MDCQDRRSEMPIHDDSNEQCVLVSKDREGNVEDGVGIPKFEEYYEYNMVFPFSCAMYAHYAAHIRCFYVVTFHELRNNRVYVCVCVAETDGAKNMLSP